MQLDKLTVNVRPISADEAIDLGLNVARAWYWDLWLLWWHRAKVLVLVLVIMLARDFYNDEFSSGKLAIWFAMFYFCRPYCEITMLLYLSRKLFDKNHTPNDAKHIDIGTGQSLKANFKARFSHKSHMVLSVYLLEDQQGKALSERLRALSRGSGNAMMRHSSVFWALEQLLVLGAFVLVMELLSNSYLGESMTQWFERFDTLPVWLVALFMAVYLLCVSMLSPFFVASGFVCYVCRRSLLEGWDIELSFRKLRARFDEQTINKWKKMS